MLHNKKPIQKEEALKKAIEYALSPEGSKKIKDHVDSLKPTGCICKWYKDAIEKLNLSCPVHYPEPTECNEECKRIGCERTSNYENEE